MRTVDLIEKKRDGGELSTEEITYLINGYVSGAIPDYQIAALAMAIYYQGMSIREIHDLTTEMVVSGEQYDLSEIPGIKVDKHSTGGVGDKVTIILMPLVASFGVPVAKMSGRGLGHTGGTIDKLESIKGYQVERTKEEFIDQVKAIGISLIGQSEHLVKADKLLYALRDVTATVDSIPLIASSVMSKKIAAGADKILLDVTVGQGAFRETIAVITDMSQPRGKAIGNRLEITEALEIMQGKGRKDITDFICELAEILLTLAQVDVSQEDIRHHLVGGQALAKFEELIQAQGGDLQDLYRQSSAPVVTEIFADEAGYIEELPAMAFGKFAMQLGAGRATKTDSLNYETGIVFEKKVGDSVVQGDLVAKVYSQENLNKKLLTEFKKNVIIDKVCKKPTEILKIIS
ncbi:pyrimidine-nucleoside phosphorylase [Streptococcus sp.]|uniref:pyrimidine-nucleoside phosphorylase n=1 Tax=Streptococcus sp. TaxID=1306 RepID=UPI00290FEA22|nr:pyrimidine-nucleoside phosphorylase [Streptococcus sp.]MDU3422231.1 pyrimidine-nucleoside phosphorylase [Streptococcus sp.]